MTCARVFVPSISERFDLAPARRFGSIEAILSERGGLSPTSPGFAESLSEALAAKRFNPSVDYLAIVGPIVACCFAMSVAAVKYGTIRVLVYDAGARGYILQTFAPAALTTE